MSFKIIPTAVILMNLVPKNIEASMYAILIGLISGAKFLPGTFVNEIYFDLFDIKVSNMENFHLIVILKVIILLILISFIGVLIPSNQRLNKLH